MPIKKNLKSLIQNHKKTIAVYGLGNVGGPIAATWLRKGAKVIGVDINKNLLNEIHKGTSHKKEPFISEIFTKSIKKGNLTLTSNGTSASKNSAIKIIAVPVDFKGNKVDLRALKSVANNISRGLKRDDIVIVCPSLPPGTTEKIVLPILEKNNRLKCEQNFYLIYNPERIYEGRAIEDIEKNYPAIVAGFGKKSLAIGEELLKIISKKGVVKLSSIANAEAEKIFEGVFRDVNIALANELSEFCERNGIDFWEARNAANSQRFCNLHYPGTGVGGLCIPVYPKFVIESAKKSGKNVKLVEYARKLNDFTPKKCVSDAISHLKNHGIKLEGKKIAILGLGFRGEVTDSRLSPTYTVVNEFLKKGCTVSVHDPYIFEDGNLPSKVILTKNLKEAVKDASLIFISTDHKSYANLKNKSFSNAKKPLLLFDGRNILNKKRIKGSLITIGSRLNKK